MRVPQDQMQRAFQYSMHPSESREARALSLPRLLGLQQFSSPERELSHPMGFHEAFRNSESTGLVNVGLSSP